jgi:TonB-linked SusC/RagA family outer membrane protein
MKKTQRTENTLRVNWFLFSLLFFSTTFLYAQEFVVTGNVTDNTGMPVPGVTILLEKPSELETVVNSKGTTTDFDGNYSIAVNGNDNNLVFSYIGYIKQTVPINSQRVINVTLLTDVSELDEVVVVGYGTQQRRDVTGAITKIGSETIERTSNATVEQALNGKISGVNTIITDGTPGAGIRIRIRGGTSINANNEPLYVIDGFPIEVDYSISDGPTEFSAPSSSPLANLDPSNIQSIDILKDASAAAIYGARGANGVVIITTKSGRDQDPEITFDTSITTTSVPDDRYVDVLSTSEYGNLLIHRELYTDGIEDSSITFADGLTPVQEQARYDSLPQTNWQKELFKTGYLTKHAIQATGGNNITKYSVGATYFKNEGAVINSFFKRYNFNVNIENKLSDKLKVKTVLFPSYSTKQGPASGGDFNQRNMGIVIRALTRRTDRGIGIVEDDIDAGIGVWVDPVTEARRASNFTNTFGFNGNTLISYNIMNGLTGSIRIGARVDEGKTKNYYTKEFGRGYINGGLGTRFHYQNLSWNNQNMLRYIKSFGSKNKHRLNALAVFEQTYVSRETEYLSVTDFPIETLGFNALQNGLIPATPDTFSTETMLKSYLTRINYGINGTYNLTLSMRADGSSRFGSKNKWGYFPSVGFAWRISDESWFYNNVGSSSDNLLGSLIEKLRANISDLKLRLSYGQTGNQGIPAYGSFSVLGVSNTIFSGNVNAGLAVTSLPNPDLKWEFTDQYDIGLDLSLFDRKVNLSTDIYYKRTEDLLLQVPIPMSTGFGSRLTNVGNVENKGLEVALNTLNFDRKFKWTSDFTFSINRNEVLNLGGVEQRTFQDQFTNGLYTGSLEVGKSLGNWIGYETNGVFSYEDFDESGNNINTAYGTPSSVNPDSIPKLGDVKYVDQNGDGLINDEDITVIARTQPKHYGSVYNNFSYKEFSLGVLFTYKYGFDVINGNKHRMYSNGYANFNQMGEMRDHWTPYNTGTDIPRADYEDRNFTSRYVEDGSFIRLQSVNLSYNFSSETARSIGLNSFQLYSNIENVFLWTKYTGFDPEVSVARGQKAITSQNLDYGAYPRTLNVRFGVKIGF